MESLPRLSGGRTFSPDRPEETSGCPGPRTITKLSGEQEQKLRSLLCGVNSATNRSEAELGEVDERSEEIPFCGTKSRLGGAKTMTTCPETSGNNLPKLSILALDFFRIEPTA